MTKRALQLIEVRDDNPRISPNNSRSTSRKVDSAHFNGAVLQRIDSERMNSSSKHPRSNPTTPDSFTFKSPCGSPNGVEQCLGTPKTGRWTKREDDLLRDAVHDLGTENWKQVSTATFNNLRSATQCQQRWQKVLSVGLKKGQWTDDEDQIVRQEVAKGGGPLNVKWADVAEVLPGRLGKQVRERWQNHLDPQLSKEPWEEAEDQLLISLQAVMGNKWSEIARAFEGRSENSVKNRWNSKQRKSLAAERKLRTGSELGVLVPRFLEEIGKKPANSRSIQKASQDGEESIGIKIDFGKALKAAHSPHITTCAEFRRRPQKPQADTDTDIKEAGALLIDILRN